MRKRAWLRVALLFALFEGAVYGVASWAERAGVASDWGIPRFVTVTEPDGTLLTRKEADLEGLYVNYWRWMELHPSGLVLWRDRDLACWELGYVAESLPVRGSWAVAGSELRLSGPGPLNSESLQVIAAGGRVALRDAQGELWRPSP
jgi:hypothetical protein